MLGRAWGIGRSMVIYHGVPGKHRRMLRFYREFLGPGDVGFDIGAHVGSRVRAWRQLGARVIAVEPQPDCLGILRLFFGRDQGVTIVPGAAGAQAGRARLGLSTATPTVSSMSPNWIESVVADRSFARVRWDRSVEVEVATLDDLIALHGLPAFCKIDVEGFEVDVLAGLTRPLRALSFEYLPPAHDAALAAMGLVERLGAAAGGYLYNYSPIETMRLASDRWLDAADLVQLLERFRPLGRSGDVYARLAQPDRGAMSEHQVGLHEAGITVEGMEPLRTAAHSHNGGYLRTEEKRLDHLDTAGEELEPARIATPNGDSKWINDEEGVPCRTRCGTATR